MVRDSEQSVAKPQTTRPSGQVLSGERQRAVSDSALRPLGHQGRPLVVRDSEQSVAKPQTTRPSGQVLSGERQRAVSDSALRPLSHQGRSSVVRDSEQSVTVPLDHSAIRAGP